MDLQNLKSKIYGELATMAKSLANPHRLRILELLGQGPRTVELIASETGLTAANASQHLQTLKAARLVETERRGKYSYYSLSGFHVYDLWNSLRKAGFMHNNEVNQLLDRLASSRTHVESVTADLLLQRLEEGNTLVLDVRPEDEYESGHITNAISIPVQELTRQLNNLPKNKQIVAYCRGPLCVMADDAIEILRKHRYTAARLDTGFPEWKLQGLPVEEGAPSTPDHRR